MRSAVGFPRISKMALHWPSEYSMRVLKGALVGAVIVGGVGFLAGFVGPIIFTPDANQGPLLGIFITGPLGALLGAVVGAVVALRRRPH
jgi:preprotein translocase subunit Sss1